VAVAEWAAVAEWVAVAEWAAAEGPVKVIEVGIFKNRYGKEGEKK